MANKQDKYGDDSSHESWLDNNIFLPIATRLVDPLYQMGLTPNNVTIISTLFTFISIYFIHIKQNHLAAAAYFFGYTLDCVDGRMARKYSMGSDVGMALDATSDAVSNIALFSYLIYTKKMPLELFVVLLIFSVLISLAYGLNEAIATHKLTGSDNFYQRRVEQLKDKKDNRLLYDMFLTVTNSSYKTYKQFFPEYNKEKINYWLSTLKEFGPGTYCVLVTVMLLCIGRTSFEK